MNNVAFRKSVWICSLLLGSSPLVENVRAVVIDDFSVGSISLFRDAAPAETTQTGLDPAHVLGGSRHILLGAFGSTGQMVEIDAAAGTLSFSSGPTTSYLNLDYGTESPATSFDLTAGGGKQLIMTLRSISDMALVDRIWVEVFAGPNFNRRQLAFQNVPGTGGAVQRIAPFDQFPDLDWSDVRQLQLVLGRWPGGGSFVLDRIATNVPEPSTSLLILLGLFIVGQSVARSRRWIRK